MLLPDDNFLFRREAKIGGWGICAVCVGKKGEKIPPQNVQKIALCNKTNPNETRLYVELFKSIIWTRQLVLTVIQ